MPSSSSTEARAAGALPLQFLPGAGPQFAAVARSLGIDSVQALAFHLPHRYEDRRAPRALASLRDGEDALVRGQIRQADLRHAARRSLRVVIGDDSGGVVGLRFLHFGDALRKSLGVGRWVQAFGAVRLSPQGLEIIHPELKVADSPEGFSVDRGFTPIYRIAAGVTQPRMRQLIQAALHQLAGDAGLACPLPGLDGPDTLVALRQLHSPATDDELDAIRARRAPAQRRLIQEELLAHQLCLRSIRQGARARPAPSIDGIDAATAELQAELPFRLTAAQHRVLREIGSDLRGRRPMLRLLQGDVGSGKTLVAAAAALASVRAGWQVALLAPTELLAEQHARNLQSWLAPLQVNVVLLAGKLRKTQKYDALAAVAEGRAQLVVGTHAVFQGSVQFARLALMIVDEQHRFGVQQRLALRDKGSAGGWPHQLVMSATPIPRTLAQTLYADLDVSVIDELPPGRSPVATAALSNERRDEVLARVAEACRLGRQAYWVCTLIDENEVLEAEAASAIAERLRAELPDLRVGLVHGRLKAAAKDAAMQAFKRGELDLLVATTVIEVGVDVPNASIMVIENAERLGLSQLHQLRGRVGRGSAQSSCVLMYQPPLSDTARARLQTLRSTADGFRIAERDLELRGPGEILGRRQTGLVGLRIADPLRDAEQIPQLQALADEYLQRHPALGRLLIRRWIGDPDQYAAV